MSFPSLSIIGERINPGFASAKKLIEARDVAGLQELARVQAGKGAVMINVNLGCEVEKDPSFMTDMVKALQAVTDLPLSFDSPSAAVQEACLKVYDPAKSQGRLPFVNSAAETRWEVMSLRKHFAFGVLLMASERLEDGKFIPNRSGVEVHDTARRLVDRIRCQHTSMPLGDIIIDVSLGPMASDTENLTRMAVDAVGLIGTDASLRGTHMSVGLSNLGIMLPKKEVAGLPIGLALECAFLTTVVPLGLDRALATAGRAYQSLPEGHPALDTFRACIAADGYDSLLRLRKLYAA